MKHFMQPRNAILKETQSPELSSSPISGMFAKSKPPRKQRSSKENAPPSDLNSMAVDSKPSPATAAKLKSPLPPRPPSSNPLKRKLIMESVPENSNSGLSDSGVKVVVRMRPPCQDRDEGQVIVEKLSDDSLSINGQTFNFDAISDIEATQVDIFELLGAPLVENCMSGFNSSVFAYGQTGSGKTYTMWGPADALSDENSPSHQQGLTPRVFERLFARLSEEQIKHTDKQLKYQCHCSFLEIYNEQITDLLDPNRKNLQIREDVKSGVYVENLSEECVCTMADVTQLLIKGLSNRRTGATSINSESSRSHTVFTCVVESRCKVVADGLSSFKTSRINLVDLAGSERQKLTGAAGERLKEAGNINRSLSQLGNLINILAEISLTGKQRHIPYRDSRLTFLLQESLGGNAKLAMICSISPSQSCKSETFSTLRFAQRAKSIKNKAVVNEVMQDDVKHLREVIRQLKDELHRIKENGYNPNVTNGGHSTAWLRRSLSLIKSSLHHPVTLPHLDNDSDEEMEIDEEAVEKLCVELGNQSAGCGTVNLGNSFTSNSKSVASPEVLRSMASLECDVEDCCDLDVKMEIETSMKDEVITDSCIVIQQKPPEFSQANSSNSQNLEQNKPNSNYFLCSGDIKGGSMNEESPCKTVCNSNGHLFEGFPESMSFADAQNSNLTPSTLRIVSSNVPTVLKSPTPSVSPRISSSRKSLRTSSMLTASQNLQDDNEFVPEDVHNYFSKSSKSGFCNRLSTQKSRSSVAPTETLAESIRHGLEVIDTYRHSLAVRRSSFRFSYKPAELKVHVEKVDVGVQTLSHDEAADENLVSFVCKICKSKMTQLEVCEAEDTSNLQLVPIDGSDSAEKAMMKLSKVSHDLSCKSKMVQLEVCKMDDTSNLQLVPVNGSNSAEKSKMQLPKVVEKVLAGAIRREMALEEFCSRQASEIIQLNRLVHQYKHERECNSVLGQTREDKILRLESLMDGVLPNQDFLEEELASLTHEHKVLKEKHENHPEVLRTQIELKRAQDELENYRNFYDLGEKEVLLEEIQDLRSQLQYYVDSSCSISRKHKAFLQLNYSEQNLALPQNSIAELTDESPEDRLQKERLYWTEMESKWISLSEELRSELDACKSLVEKKNCDLEIEKRCGEELKEAMQMAMKGHARLLEQYADLEEKHMQLLARHRKIQEGIVDVKKAASKAGVKGAESKFINALASEISALKVEREKERRYFRDENKGLQTQLRDTVEAVQAAGELLVRLRDAEEAVAASQKRAIEAERETEKAYDQNEKLKKKHEKEIQTLHLQNGESRFPTELMFYDDPNVGKYDNGEPHGADDQQWRKEFEPFYDYADENSSQEISFQGYGGTHSMNNGRDRLQAQNTSMSELPNSGVNSGATIKQQTCGCLL